MSKNKFRALMCMGIVLLPHDYVNIHSGDIQGIGDAISSLVDIVFNLFIMIISFASLIGLGYYGMLGWNEDNTPKEKL